MNAPYGQTPNVTMTPDLMYNIVNSNPAIKNAMEQAVKLQMMQQQAAQVAPMLQQLASNPGDVMNGFINWQQQQPVQQQMQTEKEQPQPSAQEKLLTELDKLFADIRTGLSTILEKCESNEQALELIMSEISSTKPINGAE